MAIVRRIADVGYRVYGDDEQLRNVAAMLEGIKNGMPFVIQQAVTEVAKSARTEVSRQVSKELAIAKKHVDGRIRVRAATYNKFAAAVTMDGKRIPLIAFSATQPKTAKGVRYRIGTRGRTELPGTFITTMKSGHKGVFKRAGKSRHPIVQRFGPSVGFVFENEQLNTIATDVINQAAEKLPQRIMALADVVLHRGYADRRGITRRVPPKP